MRISFFIAAIFVSFIFSAAAQTATPATNYCSTLKDLRARLDARLNDPRFAAALWGVKVVSLTTGKTIYENHADRLMAPASNSKLYTGALALNTLGGDYQIATPIFATSRPDGFGRINGDLIISGRGDPSWKAANFWDNFAPFISALTNAGVKRVTGDLICDNTFFHSPPFGSSWCVDDLSTDYGAPISALTLEDNYSDIHASPGDKTGDPCKLELAFPDTGIVLVNRTKTVARGGRAYLDTEKLPGSNTYYVTGEMPLGARAEILDAPVPDPAAWFAAALKNALAKNGIAVEGQVRTVEWPDTPSWNENGLVKIGAVKSPPLRDLIHSFMKPSQNLETDLIFEHVGATSRPDSSRSAESLALGALQQFLRANKIPADVHFDEGSGLSRNNLTSADATTALLALMSTNRWARDYYNALPIAGVDGTLHRRMKNTPAFENVHAKTGSLRWANSLSGYVTTAAGEKLVFSLMLNRYTGNTSHTSDLDYIAEQLAGFTGRSDEE